MLEEKIPIKIEKEIKKEPKGLSVTILKNNMKEKTRKSLAKRFKVTKSGKVLRRTVGQDHLLSKKSSDKKRSLKKMVEMSAPEAKKIKKLLGV